MGRKRWVPESPNPFELHGADVTSSHLAGISKMPVTVRAMKVHPGAEGSGSPPIKLKRTFYLDRDSVVALSEMQAEEFRTTGHKPDLSELIARGIQLLRRPVQ